MTAHPDNPEHDEEHRGTGDLNIPLILTVGAVSVILLLVSVWGTQAWYEYETRLEFQRKVVSQPFEQLQQLERQQEQELRNGPAWVDQEAGLVEVPVEQAMAELVNQQRQGDGQ